MSDYKGSFLQERTVVTVEQPVARDWYKSGLMQDDLFGDTQPVADLQQEDAPLFEDGVVRAEVDAADVQLIEQACTGWEIAILRVIKDANDRNCLADPEVIMIALGVDGAKDPNSLLPELRSSGLPSLIEAMDKLMSVRRISEWLRERVLRQLEVHPQQQTVRPIYE